MPDPALPPNSAVRSLTGGLVSYLREYLSALEPNKVRDSVADSAVFWLDNVRPYFTDAELRLPCPPSAGAPGPPAQVRHWLTNADGWGDPDGLDPELSSGATVDVREQYDRWLASWRRWAGDENANAQLRSHYTTVENLRREAISLSDTHELVFGLGLLSIVRDGRFSARRHLLICEVTVTLDTATDTLHVALPGTPSWRAEDREFLTGADGFRTDRSSIAMPEVVTPDEGLGEWFERWRRRSWNTDLAVDSDHWAPPENAGGGDTAELVLAPALLLRPRGQSAVLRMYDAIAAQLSDPQQPVPAGLANLLAPLAISGPADLPLSGLFPLPSNREQRRILEKLRTDSMVVVQGPPGTGKTHTIANLICALLADGQRVLITSQKDQALEVLRNMLPPDIRRLCVLMAGKQRTGADELNDSLITLSELLANADPAQLENGIDRLQRLRRELNGQIRNFAAELRAARSQEYVRRPVLQVGLPARTLAEIAQFIVDGKAECAWIGALPYGADAQPPLTNDEALELLHLLRTDTPERAQRCDEQIPGPDELPAPNQVAAAIAAAGEGWRALGIAADDPAWAVMDLDDGGLTELCGRVEDVAAAMAECGLTETVGEWDADDWPRRAVEALLRRRDVAYWNTVFDDAVAVVGHEAALAAVADRDVEVQTGPGTTVPPRRLLHQALALRRYLSTTGRMPRLIRPKPVVAATDLLTACTVNGSPPQTGSDLDAVIITLRAEIAVSDAAEAWTAIGARLSPGILRRRLAQLKDIATTVVAIRQLVAARDSVDQLLRKRHVRYAVGSVARWDLIVRLVHAVPQLRQARHATRQLVEFEEPIAGWAQRYRAAPQLRLLLTALRERDAETFVALSDQLQVARVDQHAGRRLLEYTQRLDKAHPDLAENLRADPHAAHWQHRLTRFENAWTWAYANQVLADRGDVEADKSLERQLDDAEQRLLAVTRELAGVQALLQCKQRSLPEELIALQEFRSATTSIGRGGSEYKAQYRQAARIAMDKARNAVPAWVIPLPELADNVPARPDVFDVVIVDEASQVPVQALYLRWLAPRIVVVGDEEQCTPQASTKVSYGEAFAIRDRHLPGLDDAQRHTLGPNSNLYELMSARDAETIRLSEHFRSMPEIIGWSSRMFYRDALVPLRQFGTERLTPLRVVQVPDGEDQFKDSAQRNHAEADLIVEHIVQLVADPANHRRTIGVVVMKDCHQIKVIETNLRRRIDNTAYERAKISVGSPPDFQGEERDIIMLSLVDSKRRSTLRSARYRRAYNVAASRARDQLWLFTSIDMSTLEADDLRNELYQHMRTRSPQSHLDPAFDSVNRDELREPFESITQQRVFRELRDRGFEVIPQYKIGDRRIDLLVVGSQGRLAVECDGPAVPRTPEEIAEDINHDRELRRCQWRIVRIRESEFVLDPQAALAPLWHELRRRGIDPRNDAKEE